MQTQAPPKPLLPETVSAPWFLALTNLLPQCLLLIMNLRAYWLVNGEMNPDQHNRYLMVMGFQVLLLKGPLHQQGEFPHP